jgi:hypothetical protein
VFRLELPNMYRVVIRRGYKDVLQGDGGNGPADLIINRICELLEQEGSLNERDNIRKAQENRVTYLMSTIEYAAAPGSKLPKRLLFQTFNFIRKNTRGVRRHEFGVPNDKLIEVGMRYDI